MNKVKNINPETRDYVIRPAFKDKPSKIVILINTESGRNDQPNTRGTNKDLYG
jgi:hypothetical protein